MANAATQVQELYVAYFSRPADPNGLNFWSGKLATDPAIYQTISSSFAESVEYKSMYGGKSNADLVNTVYQNLFGRSAEKTGLDFWVSGLESGAITIDDVVTEIAAGAQNSDLFAFNAKVAVASAFTARVDLPSEVDAYASGKGNGLVIDLIASVKDLISAATARDPGYIDTVISQMVQANVSGYHEAELIGVADLPPPIM